jgi:outer membrane lipoprotein SlyB
MKLHFALVGILLLTACAPQHGQNKYTAGEVGRAADIDFGKVLSVRKIEVNMPNTGIGASSGMALGSAAGYQFGNGNGQIGGLIAGMVIGGIAGHIAEQEAQSRVGYEYTIKIDGKKKPIAIVQHQMDGDKVFAKGDKVMVQDSGGYQRVLEVQ